VEDDNLGDWRIESVTTVAKPIGDVQVGTPVRLMSIAKHKKHKFLSFVTPSAPALCLNVALNAAALAEGIRPRLNLTPMRTHTGKRGFQIKDESMSDLFYFFEQSIVAVTMSFQALELFANGIIGRRATGELSVKRKGGIVKSLSPKDAERELSTEEKFGQVLPTILNVKAPVGNRVWQSFKQLKAARDSTVHLKSSDMFTKDNFDRESLFFFFLNRDTREFPQAAIKIIDHYFPSGIPRWLKCAKDRSVRDSQSPVTLADEATRVRSHW
jgi:hypothetical protein